MNRNTSTTDLQTSTGRMNEGMKPGFTKSLTWTHPFHKWPPVLSQNSISCVMTSPLFPQKQSNPILGVPRCGKNTSNFPPPPFCLISCPCVFPLSTDGHRWAKRLAQASIRCNTNASNMGVKFLAMFDLNCRLNVPKSGKLVGLLIVPDIFPSVFFSSCSPSCLLLPIVVGTDTQDLKGLQHFIHCSSLASVLCVEESIRAMYWDLMNILYFWDLTRFRFKTQPWNLSRKTPPSSHLLPNWLRLKWVIHREWIVVRVHVTHLRGTRRRVISLLRLSLLPAARLQHLRDFDLLKLNPPGFIPLTMWGHESEEKWNWKILLN